jgi:glycosyltransferase involved in cell wall biosynthesis
MGGAERQALYLVEHLARLGACKVELLSFTDGSVLRPHLRSLGVPVHVFSYFYRWPRRRRAVELARLGWMLRTRLKPDALLPFVGVHSKTMAQVWPYSGAQFCWWNQQDEGRDLTGTDVESRILQRVSRITSNSVTGRDFLVDTYGLDPASVLVYNNGTPLLEPVPADDLRSRLGLGQRQIVSMVANVTSFKDHATLLNAWAIVRAHFGGADGPVLLLAGGLSERATVTRLQLQAFEIGLSSADVLFLGPVENVVELMSASDVVVHSSLTEGCPNAVCEAMALGRAVVATDIAGCRQALGDDAEESLATPRDPEALAASIIRMLEDPKLRASTGARNRARVRSEFSIEGMNRFFQQLIEEGLGVSLA